MKRFSFLILLVVGLVSTAAAATLSSDGSRADVQAKINSAVDGDTVTIPAGVFAWTTTVTISGKGIKLEGAGGGKAKGYSATGITMGTGSQTFTTQAGLGWTAGEAIRVHFAYPVNGANPGATAYWANTYMIGTVTSYSGTSLVLNITTVVGTGGHLGWNFSQDGATMIHVSGNAVNGLDIYEDASQSVEVSGLHMIITNSTGQVFGMRLLAGGKPTLVHDCQFVSYQTGKRMVDVTTPRGVFWNNYFHEGVDCGVFGFVVGGGGITWSNASTIGMLDTAGTNNIYVEDCWFLSCYLQCSDFDANSRVVWRHNNLANSGMTSHGADTGPQGARQWEVYKNNFYFGSLGPETVPVDYFLFLRGGTGLVASNSMPNITSSEWGDKSEFKLTVYNVQFAPQITCQTNYPAYQQVGMGYSNGVSGSQIINGVYGGDVQPVYIWQNGSAATPSIVNWGTDTCGNGLVSSTFIQLNRDYFFSTDNTAAKPGWTPYTYPHPLRTVEPGPPPAMTLGPGMTLGSGITIR